MIRELCKLSLKKELKNIDLANVLKKETLEDIAKDFNLTSLMISAFKSNDDIIVSFIGDDIYNSLNPEDFIERLLDTFDIFERYGNSSENKKQIQFSFDISSEKLNKFINIFKNLYKDNKECLDNLETLNIK